MGTLIGDIFQGIGNSILGIATMVQAGINYSNQRKIAKEADKLSWDNFNHQIQLLWHAPVDMKVNLLDLPNNTKYVYYSIAVIVLVVIIIVIFQNLGSKKVATPAA